MAKSRKRKVRRSITKAIAHVKATFNNTIITITDPAGEVLCWDSAGTIGFKGSRKSTPFAAQRAAETVAEKARKLGVREVEVKVKGPGIGPRVGHHGPPGRGHRRPQHRGRDASAARRLPSPEEAPRVTVADCARGARSGET